MTYPDPAVAKELEGWIVRSVDTDKEPDLARAMGATSIPVAFAVDGKGEVLAKIQGYKSPEDFRTLLVEARTR